MEGLNPLASAAGNWADWSKIGTGEQQMQGQQHTARKNAGGISYPVRRNARLQVLKGTGRKIFSPTHSKAASATGSSLPTRHLSLTLWRPRCRINNGTLGCWPETCEESRMELQIMNTCWDTCEA
jgi:hypothetical protein